MLTIGHAALRVLSINYEFTDSAAARRQLLSR